MSTLALISRALLRLAVAWLVIVGSGCVLLVSTGYVPVHQGDALALFVLGPTALLVVLSWVLKPPQGGSSRGGEP